MDEPDWLQDKAEALADETLRGMAMRVQSLVPSNPLLDPLDRARTSLLRMAIYLMAHDCAKASLLGLYDEMAEARKQWE
jgi:hypothetical protein